MSRTSLAILAALALVLVACSSNPIESADSCDELDTAAAEALNDPDLSGDELVEMADLALERAIELQE